MIKRLQDLSVLSSAVMIAVVVLVGLSVATVPSWAEESSCSATSKTDVSAKAGAAKEAVGAAPSLDALHQLAKASPMKSTPSTSLLLPYYRVDTTDGSSDTTLYALRNESLGSIDVVIKYYEVDAPQAAQREDTVTLASKQIYPINVRDISGLEQDEFGIAEGYVTFEVSDGETRAISGDYFQVTPGDAFATGERLVDISATEANQLCSAFSTRFLSGGAFSGGTTITYWLYADALPLDPGVFSYSIYNEAGSLVFNNTVPLIAVAGQIEVEQLLGPFSTGAGAVEIEFTETVGFVSATMSASGLFSVGMNALCRN